MACRVKFEGEYKSLKMVALAAKAHYPALWRMKSDFLRVAFATREVAIVNAKYIC
jgi:hypothetical protein